MTAPRLYPEGQQMHAYLDRWLTHIEQLEVALALETRKHQEDNSANQLLINELQQKVRTQAEPLEHQIAGLNQELTHARNQIAALEHLQRECMGRLAAVLEISPNARGTSLEVMVTQAVLVVEESKQMVREHL